MREREMLRRGISVLRNNGGSVSDENPNFTINNGVERDGEGSVCEIIDGEVKIENDGPPVDDVCPICFGDFTVACKTNCGHWFCGNCIMQFWHYKSTIQRCKCPICSRLISVLTPEACLLVREEKEVVDVLRNVHKYNCLFQGGFRGFLQNVLAVPFLITKIVQGLMDPDRFRVNYYTARFIGLLLGLLYNISPFEFIPTGRFAVHRFFELCAVLLVVVLCLIGLFCRAISQRRLRRLAAAHNWNDL